MPNYVDVVTCCSNANGCPDFTLHTVDEVEDPDFEKLAELLVEEGYEPPFFHFEKDPPMQRDLHKLVRKYLDLPEHSIEDPVRTMLAEQRSQATLSEEAATFVRDLVRAFPGLVNDDQDVSGSNLTEFISTHSVWLANFLPARKEG